MAGEVRVWKPEIERRWDRIGFKRVGSVIHLREMVDQVAEINPRLDFMSFGAGQQAHPDRGGFARGVVAQEQPIFASDRAGRRLRSERLLSIGNWPSLV